MNHRQTLGVHTRRCMLNAAGVSMALPLLESARANDRDVSAVQAPPLRFLAINIPLGFYGPQFFPTTAGKNYELTLTLKPAESVRKHFTVVSGCSHPDVDGGHSAEASFLTAAPHPGARNFRNTISFDQVVASHVGHHTRFSALTLGDTSLSWSANGVSVPPERAPEKVFARLFLQGSPQEVARQKQRLQDGHSILDVVRQDARSMRKKLSVLDRQKLEQYFTAVRAAELRLSRAELWVKSDKPKVDVEAPRSLPSEDLIGRLRLHLDVIQLAFQSDSTRVVTLGGHNGSLVPPIKGVEKGYHALTHHGRTTGMIRQLQAIDLETIRVWSEFIARLLETTEGDSNLLARTHILLGSNLGNANAHTTDNLPLILAGGAFRHAGHLAYDSENNTPFANAFVAIAAAMKIPVDSFASSSGRLPGLQTI